MVRAAVLGAAGCVVLHGSVSSGEPLAESDCAWTWQETSREPLTIPGHGPMIIDVSAIVMSAEADAILGPQTVIWGDDTGLDAELGSAVGAVVPHEGAPFLIPAPDPWEQPLRVGGVSLSDGRWLVVWVEGDRPVSAPGLHQREVEGLWQGIFDGQRWSDVRRIPVNMPEATLDPFKWTAFAWAETPFWVIGRNSDGGSQEFLLILQRDPDGSWRETRVDVRFTPAITAAPPLVAFTHNAWREDGVPQGVVSTVDVSASSPVVTERAVMDNQNAAIDLFARATDDGLDFVWHAYPDIVGAPLIQGISEGSSPDTTHDLASYEQGTAVVLASEDLPLVWFAPTDAGATGGGGSLRLDVVLLEDLALGDPMHLGTVATDFAPRLLYGGMRSTGRTLLIGAAELDPGLTTVLLVGHLDCTNSSQTR